MGIIAFLVLLLFCYFWNYFRFSQLCALIVTMCRRLAAWAMAFYFMIGQWFLQWCLLKCFCPAATWFLSPVTSAPVLIYILTKKRITNTKILDSSHTDCFSHITVSSALFCVELSIGRKLIWLSYSHWCASPQFNLFSPQFPVSCFLSSHSNQQLHRCPSHSGLSMHQRPGAADTGGLKPPGRNFPSSCIVPGRGQAEKAQKQVCINKISLGILRGRLSTQTRWDRNALDFVFQVDFFFK